MDPMQTIRTLAEFWSQSGKSFWEQQQQAFRDTDEQTRLAGGTQVFEMSKDIADYETARRTFSEVWSSALGLSSEINKAAQSDKQVDPLLAAMLGKIFDPKAWFQNGMDEALQRTAEGPQLADLWSVERKFAAIFTAWIALRRRTVEHNTILLEAWRKAAGVFARELNQRADKGDKLESSREMLLQWVEIANEVLLETQRSDAFLGSQRELLKASTDLRLAQRELSEYYGEMFGYPTRSEIDDVHKTVTELRRELRKMRRDRDSKAIAPPGRQRQAHVARTGPKRVRRKQEEAR